MMDDTVLLVDFRQNIAGRGAAVPQFAVQECTEHPGRCVVGTITGVSENGFIRMATFDDPRGRRLNAFVDLGNNRLATADLEFSSDGQEFQGTWSQGRYGSGRGTWSGSRTSAGRRRRR